ncbi:hypothetical protein NDU88_004275 [Pleurodeles waltl]|uniref:Uncharacterized protein n=1 Tax=Pleurodeles waltl TaxID=8319 RepID=A0AAV7WTN0_PLEWA|nr:hypothetical protein NDU88_004275 [Pleurodeles waltl]
MTADTRRVFAYSFPYLTPFYNVPVSFGNRNAGKVFIWQSKRNASSRTRLKAYPYKGNTSCDLFRIVGGITLNEYLYLFVALEYTDLKLLVNYYNSRLRNDIGWYEKYSSREPTKLGEYYYLRMMAIRRERCSIGRGVDRL